MTTYNYSSNNHRSMIRWQRARKVIVAQLLVVLVILGVIGLYIWRQLNATSAGQTSKNTKVTLGQYVANPKRSVSNQVFYFESSRDWQFSQDTSRPPDRYVFYSLKNNLIEYELNIFFDKSLSNTSVNYIMPVTVQAGKITAQLPSPRCASATKSIALPMEYKGVRYFCNTTGSNQVIAAGVVGGSYDIPMYNSKGTLRIANFVLKDSSANHYPDTFKEIVESFKLQ